jgi:hypothetical protein
MRRPMLPRAVRLVLATALALSALTVTAPSAAPVARAGGGAIPDLSMAPLDDFVIQWVNGRRLLRFTAMMVNVGDGQFELRGHRAGTGDPMVMDQIVYNTASRSSGIAQQLTTQAVAKYSGDGHDHWHVQEMMRYDLWGGGGTLRGAKVGYCFLDSDPYWLNLPNASDFPYYRGSWCSTDPNILSNRMGISIGWGDEYTWDLAWQWVDITGLGAGTYTVRSKVDPYGYFLETNESNQCAFARVSFTANSNAVSVLERGTSCPNDWSGSGFSEHIAWMYETGLTEGCAPDLFCTYNPVSREQMAAFLSRALDLPATPNDYFTDDDGTDFEVSINRVAAAGIATGCGAGRFCPTRDVTRGEMAAFLARGFALPATTNDYFADDDGTTFEVSINRVARAGIASGCTATRFCPDRLINRGEMAAFLHRALD